ncbi:DUF707 domain-containing protein [Paraburkholderia sp. MMS20-SJTN17]|uniref:DUF707 domain-containing protein n=1 Tax=Paraburkholderia translucens TaxID=2886945 RepID=A0ABS8KDM9_9BURK|nr:DUF707 domain-containing protein [Paraburkholderia sp. MMS20-SJTN17]MCC8402838.1 DUF707 domain-containing protein [Paraburkholderia sp. MMS20-SJTN17]
MLSYYGKDENYADVFAKSIHRFKGSKWEGLNDFMLQKAQSISHYRYIWLPDDDILTDVQTLNEFFEYVERENFALAQPSLDERSYFSHATTLQNKAFDFRETNFVEVMAPCFSSNALHVIKDSFGKTKTGWGLDFAWPGRVATLGKVGIVDRFSVLHTRPIGSADHSIAWSELHQTLAQYRLRASIKVRQARTSDAGKIYTSGRLGNPMLFIHAVRGSHPVRRKNLITYFGLLKEYVPWLHYTKRKMQPYRLSESPSRPLE